MGEGGLGIVYAARDPQGREVAVKALLGSKGAAEATKVRMRREVQTLRRLDHSGLVRVLDEGEEGGVPWFAMERLEGESLQDLLRTQGPLVESAALELGIQLCEALSVAHAEGVLHRDVKPENLIRVGGGRYVLIDFGLTKDLSQEASVQLSQTGALQGTPGYWAPEQASGEGKRATVQTDVYGVGALLYGATTGRPPISTASLLEAVVATLEQVPDPPSSLASLSPGFDETILRCLEKAPERRFATLSELAETLRGIQSGSHVASPSAEAGPKRKPVGWLLGLVVLGLVGGGGLLGGHKARVASAARVAAGAELSAFLEPGGDSRRFAALSEKLPGWRAALQGGESPGLQLAEGLAAIGRQERGAAEQALARLRETAAGQQARLLRAAVHARWSKDPVELGRARRVLRARVRREGSAGGLLDLRLLLGRAEFLGGSPLRASAEFARAERVLGEPWRGLALGATRGVCALGKLDAALIQRLGQVLPDDGAELQRLGAWSDLAAAPSVKDLVALVAAGQEVPEGLFLQLQTYATQQLGRARIGERPRVDRGDSGHWGELILELKIPPTHPLPPHIYERVLEWVLLAPRLKLPQTERVRLVTLSVLEVGDVLNWESGGLRLRLFEAYLEAGWEVERALGVFALTLADFHSSDGSGRPRALLFRVTRAAPLLQRQFWDLWLACNQGHLLETLLEPERRPKMKALYPRLREHLKWFDSLSEEERQGLSLHQGIALILQDPIAFEVYTLRAEALAAIAAGLPLEGLDHFRKLAENYPNRPSETWLADYCGALHAAVSDPKTGTAKRAALRGELLERLPLAVLNGARRMFVGELAWKLRGGFRAAPKGALIIAKALTWKDEAIRQAWFYLACDRPEAARESLRRARQDPTAERQVGTKLRKLAAAKTEDLTLEAIESVEQGAILVAAPILAPKGEEAR